MTFPPDFVAILPLVAAVVAAIVVLLVDLAVPGRRPAVIGAALLSLAVVAVGNVLVGQETGGAVGGSDRGDALKEVLDLPFVAMVGLTNALGPDHIVPR